MAKDSVLLLFLPLARNNANICVESELVGVHYKNKDSALTLRTLRNVYKRTLKRN